MSMQINMTVWGTGPTVTNNKLRYLAFEASAPNAEVARITEDPPHSFPHPVTINVPNPVVHIVKIYTTPDESLGSLISEFIYDPTYTNVEVRMPLELMVGGSGEFDPADGAQAIPVIPSLIGWDWYPEMRSKGGTLYSGEYDKLESVLGNGVDYFALKGDDVFVAPDFVFIHFKPKISLSQPVFTYLNLYNGIKEITGNDTQDATYYRKLCEIVSPGPSPIIQLLPLSAVPAETILTFSTHRGLQKQATIKAAVGEIIFHDRMTDPALFMGEGEVLWIMRGETGWRVVNDWKGMANTGLQVNLEVLRPNTIIFNGGGLVDGGGNPAGLPRAIYPRAVWYVETQLLPGQVLPYDVRQAGGDNLSGFWAVDDDNIYTPDYRGHTRRALPGTRGNDADRDNSALAGSYEADQLRRHRHLTITYEKVDDNGFPPIPDETKSIVREWVKQAGAGAPGYYLVGSPTNREPEAGPSSWTGGPGGGADGETRGKNNGVIMGCYI